MKFNKQINNGTLLIPGGAFKISGFEGGEKVEIHTLDSAVVVLKKQMTTMELIQAMDALHRLATELTVHLARVCGTCDDCEDGCPSRIYYLTIKESEEATMVNQSTEKKNTREIQMTIEGHKVTVSFAQEANPTLSALVRNTLLDAYIRKNGLCGEEQPA